VKTYLILIFTLSPCGPDTPFDKVVVKEFQSYSQCVAEKNKAKKKLNPRLSYCASSTPMGRKTVV